VNWIGLLRNLALDCLEGRLDKTTNEYWTEVAIPHVLSSKECASVIITGKNKNIAVKI